MMRSSFTKALNFLSVLVIFALLPGTVFTMTTHIEKVLPRIGQQGTTVEVVVQGMCIQDAKEVIFFNPGIKAVSIEPLPDMKYPIGLAHGGRRQNQFKCKFVIAADCPPGEYPFRVRTVGEITSLATFHVSPFNTIDEDEKHQYSNDTVKTAKAVQTNVTIRGKMNSGHREDIDIYKVQVKSGQRLSVEVDSVRLADSHYGNGEYDLAVRILDSKGKEIAGNDDNSLHLQDPLLSIKAPYDGEIFVELKQSVFNPSDKEYALHISETRRPLTAYPAGGLAGSNEQIRFLGDALGEYSESVKIPQKEGDFKYYCGAPSPMRLRSSTFPNILEDKNAPFTAAPKLPAALNGIIEKSGEVDAFKISVKKGERLSLTVFASSIGSPIDPSLTIRRINDKGEAGQIVLKEEDSYLERHDIYGTSFRGGGGLKEILDPSVIWTPDADGDYLVEVRDTGDGAGAHSVFRVEVGPVQNAIHTYLNSTAFDWMECVRTSGLAIPGGNRWTVNLSLTQGWGSQFRGEMEIVAHGLPEGVRLISPRFQAPNGKMRWPIQFVADPGVKPCSAVIRLEARPVDSSQKVVSTSQQNIPFINHSGGDALRTVQLDSYILAVTDPAPFSIEVDAPAGSLVRGGELAIPVKIIRHNGFNGPVEFRCDWIPEGVGVPPAIIIPPGKNEGILNISASDHAKLGKVPFVVTASTSREDVNGYLGTGRTRVSSKLVSMVVSEPYVELSSNAQSLRRGKSGEFSWNINHKTLFEGKASVKLLGLPKGVEVIEPLPVITKETKNISFKIKASDEALMGLVKGIYCEVVVKTAGQEIKQRAGQGTLRIDPKL